MTKESNISTTIEFVKVQGEKKYKVVENMRFEEGISEEIIEENVKHYSKPLPDNLKTDDLSFFEHRVVGSTISSTNHPLTPFSILFNKKTPKELSKKRERKASPFALFNFDSDKNDFVPTHISKRKYDLQIDDSIKEVFLKLIKERIEYLPDKNKLPEIFIVFKTLKVDPKKGEIIMPNIDTMRFDGETDEKIPESLAQGIKIKQMFCGESKDYYQYIDQDGWRFDKK